MVFILLIGWIIIQDELDQLKEKPQGVRAPVAEISTDIQRLEFPTKFQPGGAKHSSLAQFSCGAFNFQASFRSQIR